MKKSDTNYPDSILKVKLDYQESRRELFALEGLLSKSACQKQNLDYIASHYMKKKGSNKP